VGLAERPRRDRFRLGAAASRRGHEPAGQHARRTSIGIVRRVGAGHRAPANARTTGRGKVTRPMAAPTTVAVGWAPYRFGHWTWVGPWGWTWVDDAPWGYAPSHYGRWLWLAGRWGWCPGGFVRRPVWAPALVGWYGGPGWAFSSSFGVPVYGWVPLSWGDPFRPHWRCSARCWRALNRPFAIDVAERPGAPARFANSEFPGAVTWVPGRILTSGKPVAVNLVRPSPSMLPAAPILATATIARGNPMSVTQRPVGAPPPAGLLRRSSPAIAPLREMTPALQARRGTSSAPAARVYGGVSDGRGAYTGVVPTPGPKLPASGDNGVPIPATITYPGHLTDAARDALRGRADG
jgi:uncharacterized protein DUF6600